MRNQIAKFFLVVAIKIFSHAIIISVEGEEY